jgi:hypothetical protein
MTGSQGRSLRFPEFLRCEKQSPGPFLLAGRAGFHSLRPLCCHPRFHPAVPIQEEEAAEIPLTPRDRARQAIDWLVFSGWLEELESTAWRRLRNLEVNAALMLKTLRQIAWPGAAFFLIS